MGYVFAAPPQAVVPIDGSTDLLPVHRIYCVGRNYVDHQKEMGFSGREAPFFFMKPADAVLPVPFGSVGEMPYPGETNNLHHEIELVVAIGKAGRNIAAADARGPHLRLRRGPRHDAARPAVRAARQGPSMGRRQGLRLLGADQSGEDDRRHGRNHDGADLARA